MKIWHDANGKINIDLEQGDYTETNCQESKSLRERWNDFSSKHQKGIRTAKRLALIGGAIGIYAAGRNKSSKRNVEQLLFSDDTEGLLDEFCERTGSDIAAYTDHDDPSKMFYVISNDQEQIKEIAGKHLAFRMMD